MTGPILYKNFKFGFCKFADQCFKRHVPVKCENSNCDSDKCEKQHPIPCKYYQEYNQCKFGAYFCYSHVKKADPVLQDFNTVKIKLDIVQQELLQKNEKIKSTIEKIQSPIDQMRGAAPRPPRAVPPKALAPAEVSPSTPYQPRLPH